MAISIDLGEAWTDIRAGVRKICGRFGNDYWTGLDREKAYPAGFVSALTEAGYLAALIPDAYGGSGLPIGAAAAILETIHASGGNAAACHAQMYVMGTLLRHGSDEQKQRFLPAIAAGELRLQAFGVTEPTTGSDTTQLKTRARLEGDHYVVSGQKIWTSRAEHSDLMVLLARTTPLEKAARRSDGLSVLLVDMNEAKKDGMEIRPIDTMINHATTEVFFDDVKVPRENLIGREGEGFRYILDGMNVERILIAAECIGDGRYFLKRATEYARERIVFDNPIGRNQSIQFPLARGYANLEAADLMVKKATAKFDAGEPDGEASNLAKLLASEAAWELAEAAMQTFGGFAFATEYGIERKWRETRLYRTAPISTNMVLAYIAQHVLGLPRSY